MANTRYTLMQDKAGMVWDLLLYVPTVGVLGLLALKLWYGANQGVAYVLFFMASFFFIAGANRILKTRLMLLSSAPVALEVSPEQIRLELRGGGRVTLVKDVRFYADSQGKSFGLSGKDGLEQPLQFVFHRGQFADQTAYREVTEALAPYK
ncbi:MAG: hypothetical protein M1527_03720 [Gammaproteobacteria bacterium]|nr:hypothetical protein [Gammaproteobacteria bacterium]